MNWFRKRWISQLLWISAKSITVASRLIWGRNSRLIVHFSPESTFLHAKETNPCPRAFQHIRIEKQAILYNIMILFHVTDAIYGMSSTLLNSPSIDRKPVNKLCRHDRCDHAGIVAMITFGWLLSWWFLQLCYGCSSNVIVRFWQTDWALRLPELLCWSFMNSSLW